MSDSKATKANGRKILGTAGRVRRGNKKISNKRNRNGKFGANYLREGEVN